MDKPLIISWARQKFSRAIVPAQPNSYNPKFAKTIYTILKVFWLLLIAGSAYYFIYINDNETQMKLFGLVAFVLAAISVTILISVSGQANKTVKIDNTGIYTAKGSCHRWDELSNVWFCYNVAFGKADRQSLTLLFDTGMATVGKKDSYFSLIWSAMETVPAWQENHFYTGKRSRKQVIRES